MNFNIFGIGLPQLIIVGGLALVLFGPKKMVQYAYQAGRMLSQLRLMWEEAARNVQQEFKDAGLDLPKDITKVGGFDISAAAMKVVQSTSTSPTPNVEATQPAADSSAVPSLNAPPADSPEARNGSEKYDAWLPK